MKRQSGNDEIYAISGDLSLKSGIAKFANEIMSKIKTLDVLIHNAGAQFGNTREVSAEEHEKTFAINVIAPFLLTHLLLPLLCRNKNLDSKKIAESAGFMESKNMESNAIESKLAKSSQKCEVYSIQKCENACVIAVSSSSYIYGKFNCNDLELEKSYSLFRSYRLSKRYEYWVMQKFAEIFSQDSQDSMKNATRDSKDSINARAKVTFNTLEPGATM